MIELLVTPLIVCLLAIYMYFERCCAVGFTFFGCGIHVDVVTGYYQAEINNLSGAGSTYNWNFEGMDGGGGGFLEGTDKSVRAQTD